MPLDLIANIAEISAFAIVIASLIYVGRQLKQNTQAMRLETVQAISAEWNSWYDMMAPNTELVALYHRGVFEFDELNGTEQLQFTLCVTRLFRTLNEQYFQWREGLMDESVWNSWMAQWNDAMQLPGWQAVWTRRRHWFDEGFQSIVDRCIEETADVRPLYEVPDGLSAS